MENTSSTRGNGNGVPFLTDVATLRERARQQMHSGAVTPNYGADPKVVVEVLNAALATEIVCVLRYKNHYFMAQGIASNLIFAAAIPSDNCVRATAAPAPESVVALWNSVSQSAMKRRKSCASCSRSGDRGFGIWAMLPFPPPRVV